MNWPAILAPLLAPNFLVTVLVITVRGMEADHQQAKELRR